MEIKNVYPPLKRKLNRRRKLRTACGWCFLAAAAACVIVNICVGGKAWSAVALWALWMIWVNSADPSAGREQPDQSERAAIDQYLHLADLDRPDDQLWLGGVRNTHCLLWYADRHWYHFFPQCLQAAAEYDADAMGDRRSYRCCYLRHLWLFAAQLADHRTGLYCRCFTDCYHCDPTLTAVC